MLSLAAFNALLKILEEPPEHILFILATTELHKVPATIQSRCQKFSFKRLSPTALATRLKYISNSESFVLTDDAVARLVALADGSMRDAISLLDQCVTDDVVDLDRVQDTLGLVGNQDLLKLIETVADRDVLSALSILEELYNDGRDMTSLLSEMTALFRDLLVFKISPDSGLLSAGLDKNALSGLSGKFSSERLFFCLDMLKNILSSLSRSGSSKLAIEICLIKMCEDTTLPVSVITVNEAEIKDSAANVVPKKVIEKDVGSENEDLTAAVIVDNVAESMTDEPSLCHTSAHPDDFWVKILDLLKREPSVRVLLNDSSKVQAALKDKLLTVNFTDSYTADQIKHSFSDLIKDAAEKVLGHNVIINIGVVESIDSDETKRSKLDSISAFVTENFN
jgi:DNA polymerase-3 subunit gamma/tau